MRLFVALEIPDEVKQEVEHRAEPLRRELPQARWVKRPAMHLTLAFLGETDPALLTVLDRHLRPTFAASVPFSVQLAGGGTFPPSRPARVAWVGIEAGDEVVQLQHRVVKALTAAVGFAAERRGFHPHLTLARCSRPWRRGEIERFANTFRGPVGPSFEILRGVLFESRLGQGGARYREVRVYPLGAGPLPAEGALP